MMDPYLMSKVPEQFQGRNKLNDTKSAASISVLTQRVPPHIGSVQTATIPIKKKADLE